MKNFELTSEQQIQFKEFKESIKAEYGKCGLFFYRFEMNSKNCPAEIYSILSGKSIIIKDSREF